LTFETWNKAWLYNSKAVTIKLELSYLVTILAHAVANLSNPA